VDSANDWRIRRAGPAAMGAIGSARGLAGLYAACLESPHAKPLVSAETLESMTQIHASGQDLVLGVHNRFGLVFQNADSRLDYGSPWAFGHDGVGGSIGFAEPAYDLAFG
jgi:CubicO group peptidase (beta-lactamase class C family)